MIFILIDTLMYSQSPATVLIFQDNIEVLHVSIPKIRT